MSKQILAMMLVTAFIIAAFTACSGDKPPQIQQNDINPFASFRDVPGVTEKEIADIERLQKEYEAFTYAMVQSTDAFVKEDGDIGGYAALFSEWLTGLFDIPFNIEFHPMSNLYEQLDSCELDFAGVVMLTEENRQNYYMTDFIAERQFVLFRLAGSPSFRQIAAERLPRYAFLENAPAERLFAAHNEPGSYETVWVRNALEGYQVLKNGDADAFFSSNNNDALYIEYGDVIIEDFFPLTFNPVAMATANPAFESIISVVTKAQQNGADSYLNHLYRRAYQDYQKHKLSVLLTEEEREYIRNNPVIPVSAISSNYPISFYNARENEWQGIFFDLLKEIEALTNLSFELVNDENTDWFVLLDMLKNKETSIIGELLWTKEREEHFIWPKTVIQNDYYALISMNDHHDVAINEIRNLKVGLARNTGYTAMFRQWFPEHEHTIEFDSIEETFIALRNGDVDLVMTTERRLMFLTHYQELTGYKLNFVFDQGIDTRLGFHKDDVVLCSIIDKALQSIETKRISNQWMHRTFDYRLKIAEARVPLLIGISISFAFIVILVLLMFLRSRSAAKLQIKANIQNALHLTKLNLMIKAARIGLWDMEIINDDPVNPKNIFMWSDEFRHMLGYENENDFPNVLSSLRNVMHPDYLEGTDKAFTAHILDKTGKTPFDVEYRLMKKNGEYSYYQACGEAIRDNDGNAIHVAGALIDITKTKTEHERLMLMLDTSPMCIGLWDTNLNIIDCSESTVVLLGLADKQDYINRFYADCLPEYQPDGLRSDEKTKTLLREAFENGYCSFEWILKKPDDGTLIPTEVTLVHAKFGDDDVVVAYTRDMREHKAQLDLIEKMRDADERMRALLEINPQVNFLFDNKFNIIDCNPAAMALMGFETKEEMLAGFVERLTKSIPELQPDGRPSVPLAVRLAKTLEEGHIKFETELYIQGEKHILDVEFKKIPHEDSFAVVGFVHELTEIKNLVHEAERQRMEAETANKAKSEFLSHISHEIRTPMNAILGASEIQMQKETNSPDVEEAFNIVYSSGNLLLNIINDILDLSKIEAGKLDIVSERYDIPSIIYDTVQLNLLRYESKPIEFNLEIDENTPLDMNGDELRIKQVLNNILSNAFKYTEKGAVQLSISAETVDEEHNKCVLVLRISDTGQGMTKEQIDKLFDEYTRFNMDTNRTIVGTGLGMHITKRLADAMNGEILVESELGKGTIFTVRLPQERIGDNVCGAELADKLCSNRFKSGLKSSRAQIVREYMPYGSVLVVDDVESNLYVAKGMMLPYGLKTETVSSGFEAVKKVKDGGEYDIIFMDHMMPKMNGMEATKIIRDLGYTNPIVVLTANAVAGSSAKFLSNGFDGFISKPIDIRELNSLLNRLIRDKQPPEVIDAARRQFVAEANQNGQIKSDLLKVVVMDIEKTLAVLEELLPRLNDFTAADIDLFSTTVHGMKSALLNIGETELSAVAFRLEQAADTGEMASITSDTPSFINALRTLIEKLAPKTAEKTDDISDEDRAILTEKLSEIKAACERIQKNVAKSALDDLKKRTWPSAINELLDEMSMCLLHGEFKKIVSAADKAING